MEEKELSVDDQEISEQDLSAQNEVRARRSRSQTSTSRGRGRGRRIKRDNEIDRDVSDVVSRRECDKGTTVSRSNQARKKVEPPSSEDRDIAEFFSKNSKEETPKGTNTQQQGRRQVGTNRDDDYEEREQYVFPNTQDKLRFQNSSMMSTPGEPPETLSVNAEIHVTPKSFGKTLTTSASKLLGSIKNYFSGNDDQNSKSQSVEKKSSVSTQKVDDQEHDDSDTSVVFDGASQASLRKTGSQNSPQKSQVLILTQINNL
jgi:hypothetical protein